MERFITQKLLKWQQSKNRKPLILRGARQVGKTYILKEFGGKYYDKVAYFSFDNDQHLANLFSETKDPQRLVEQLSLVAEKKIDPTNTLIIFDEIQECPHALGSLKYFCEEAPEYHIACAGSLLGIRLSHTSFPVGKVEFLNLYPMTFSEFLLATGAKNLVEVLRQTSEIKPLPEIFTSRLLEKLKVYYTIGGMPAAVKSWAEDRDIEVVNSIQSDILDSYENDFAKHVSESEANKLSIIWNGIPSQLARENKKFVYQAVRSGARAREYENAINWLAKAGLIIKCSAVKKCKLPLKSYQDLSSFKLYLNDVGLLRQMSRLSSNIILEGNKLFEEFKGSLTENYIINMLQYLYNDNVYFHSFNRGEIDFVIQLKNEIIPIEVKSERTLNHRSLTRFNAENDNRISIIFSQNNLIRNDKIVNIPLYLAEYLNQLNI